MGEETFCVFAYGSNMDRGDYDAWCEANGRRPAGWSRVVPAVLEGYRLVFDYRSRSRRGGAANVVSDESSRVHGLALWVSPYDLASLDLKEGRPACYDRAELPLRLSGSTIKMGWVYQVRAEMQEPQHVEPTEYYLGLIVRAAEVHGFPEDYRTALLATRRQTGAASSKS